MTSNPSYDINKGNKKQENQAYDYVMVIPDKLVHFQDNKQDTVKLNANPSYARRPKIIGAEGLAVAADDSVNVTINPNPSYVNVRRC